MTKTGLGGGVGAELKEKISFFWCSKKDRLADRDPDVPVKVYSFFGDLAFAPAFDFVGVAGYSLECEELVSSSFPLKGILTCGGGRGDPRRHLILPWSRSCRVASKS